jgi:hypothetical protein
MTEPLATPATSPAAPPKKIPLIVYIGGGATQ